MLLNKVAIPRNINRHYFIHKIMYTILFKLHFKVSLSIMNYVCQSRFSAHSILVRNIFSFHDQLFPQANRLH